MLSGTNDFCEVMTSINNSSTAFLQVTTPLLFKLIPAVVHLGVLLRWFPPDSLVEVIIYAKNSAFNQYIPMGKMCYVSFF